MLVLAIIFVLLGWFAGTVYYNDRITAARVIKRQSQFNLRPYKIGLLKEARAAMRFANSAACLAIICIIIHCL